MPSILERYFYPVETGDDDYSRTPNGPPVVSRLIKGKSDVWLSTQGEKLKPKTLLIDKQEFLFDTRGEITQKIKTLRRLLTQPPIFECYVWADDQFIKLTPYNLHILDVHADDHYPNPLRTSRKRIEAQFVQDKSVSIDSITTIDGHELREIAANKTLPFTAMINNRSAQSLASFYDEAKRPIDELFILGSCVLPEFIDPLEQYYKKKAKLAPYHLDASDFLGLLAHVDLRVYLQNITSLEGHHSQDRGNVRAVLEEASSLHSLVLTTDINSRRDAKALGLDDIPVLEKLMDITVTTNFFSPEEIASLLSKAPFCERLRLKLQTKDAEGKILKMIATPLVHLRHLYVGGQIDPMAFGPMLSSCPHLNDLELSLMMLPPIQVYPGLNHINRLNLKVGKMRGDTLLSMLKQTPYLNELTLVALSGCVQGEGAFDTSDLSLDKLKTLKLIQSSIEKLNSQLCAILNKASSLEEMVLSSYTIADREIETLIQFNHLKRLTLNKISMDYNDLTHFLNHTPNIEHLSLSTWTKNPFGISDELQLLPKLQSVVIQNTQTSIASLNSLMKKTPALKSLTLQNTHIINTWITRRCIVPLESMLLDTVTIYPTQLWELLSNTPELNTLTLNSCSIMNDRILRCHLPALHTLSVQAKQTETATGSQLSALLNAAPNLRTFVLTGSPVTEDLSVTQDLPCITTISITKSFIRAESIENLLNRATHLTDLSLSETPQPPAKIKRTGPITLKPLLQLRNLNLLGCAILSVDDLLELFDKAPNLSHIEIDEFMYLKLKKRGLFEKHPHLSDKFTVQAHDYDVRSPHDPPLSSPASDHPASRRPPSHPVDPHFDPKSHTTPSAKKDKPFDFREPSQAQHQGEMINRLSQYLMLTKKDTAIIPKIQDGVCMALSRLFYDLSDKEWQQFKQDIFSWNGRGPLNKQHHKNYGTLLHYVKKHQISAPLFQRFTYAGEALIPFLKGTRPQKIELCNAWHRITLKYNEKTRAWTVYDPNYVAAEKTGIKDEELEDILKQAIGPVVSLIGDYSIKPEQALVDLDLFFESGGFHKLMESEGTPLLPRIDIKRDYSDAALEGLLLLDIENRPAWLNLISMTATRQLAHAFLQKLIQRFPSDYQERLNKSISHLPHHEQQAPNRLLAKIPLIRQGAPLVGAAPKEEANPKIKAATADEQEDMTRAAIKPDGAPLPPQAPEDDVLPLQALLEAQHRHEEMRRALYERQADSQQFRDPQALVDTVMHSAAKRQLIEYEGYGPLHASLIKLLEEAKKEGRPVFLVNSPDDLSCSGPWIEKEADGNGLIHDEKGGPLYDFMQRYDGDGTPLIVVNYANFKPKDIIRFNTIVDAERLVDGVPIPDNIHVLGFSDVSSPHAYRGSDFHSRFDKKYQNTFTDAQWQADLRSPPQITTVDKSAPIPHDTPPFIINCYDALEWEDILLGSWALDKEKLTFTEGKLREALESKRPIVIQNGPWHNKSFELFWERLLIEGQFDGIPLTQAIQKVDGYDWQALKQSNNAHHVDADAFYSDSILLTPLSLSRFLGDYHCEDQQLIKIPGLIKQHAATHSNVATRPPIKILITRHLSVHDWAKLLDEANQQGVTLDIEVLPGVSLPEDLATALALGDSPPATSTEKPAPIIVTDDIDARVELMLSEPRGDGAIVIDGSECEPSDLLEHIDASYDRKKHQFSFKQSDKAVLTALQAGKIVFLKGPVSDELSDALQPYFRRYPKQLCLVTDTQHGIPSIPYQHLNLSTQDKKTLLKEQATQFTEHQIQQTPYVKLQAILKYRRTHPEIRDLAAPWRGQDCLDIQFNLGEFHPETAKEESIALIQARSDEINRAFETSPIVCLSGITGVGKSTFIEKELARTHNIIIGEDSNALKKWQAEGGVLFIDEANITTRGWSEFEGLFNIPPSILIEGELYKLEKDQKVIFAFNPASYSSDRESNRLFQRHGNTVVFDPLPLNVIYHDILSPLFNGTPLEKDKAKIAKPILDAYALLARASTDRVLVSARELKSIVMMAVSHQAGTGLADDALPGLVKHYTKEILAPLVPSHHMAAFTDLVSHDTEIPTIPPPHDSGHVVGPDSPLGNYLFTPSRKPPFETLNAFLSLRDFRLKHAGKLSQIQKQGGLGGLVIEGEPGIGKSILAQKVLMDWGLTKAPDDEETHESVYYVIPASLSNAKKRALLLKAFDEGAPVIMDEMNSASMLERTLNDLLMGKHPDEHRGAKQPGFMIIATQNPILMKGRVASSQALNRRMAKISLPHYPREEMLDILRLQGLPEVDANALVEVYLEERDEAMRTDLPPLNFRDLMGVSTSLVEAKKARIEQRETLLASLVEQRRETSCHDEALIAQNDPSQDDTIQATPPALPFDTLDLAQLAILNEIKTNYSSTFQRLCHHDMDFIQKTITLFQAHNVNNVILTQLLDLRDIEQERGLNLTDAYFDLFDPHRKETGLQIEEQARLFEFLKLIDVSQGDTDADGFVLLDKHTTEETYSANLLIKLLEQPFPDLTPSDKTRLMVDCLLAWSREPHNVTLPNSMIALHQYIKDLTEEGQTTSKERVTFFSSFRKGPDEKSKISAAENVYQFLRDPQRGIVLTKHEQAALQNGRLKDLIAAHHIQLPTQQTGPEL